MSQKVKDVSEEHVPKTECHHYWLIESAKGPASRGVCKICGAKREFLNSLPKITPVKGRQTHIFDLPELPDVELDEDSNS